MKVLILVASLAFASSAFAEVVTTVNCADTQGIISGAKDFRSNETSYNAEELKNILLGSRQLEWAPMPYPSEVFVAPKATDLQGVTVYPGSAFPGFVKSLYFTLKSANFVDLFVFCTISQLHYTHNSRISMKPIEP